jgi:glucosylceramidase
MELQGAVHAWLTTGDQKNLLAQRDDMIGAPDGTLPTVTVDPAKTYQTAEGFGASLTDSSAHLIVRSSHRDAT